MSFAATPDATVPVDDWDDDDIANDGFFPDIEMRDAREVIRIDGTITPPRLRAALVDAMASVNDELAEWQAAQMNVGRETLATVPAPLLDGISRHMHRYKRAVYCLAKANLVERYRDYDSAAEGNKRADEMDETLDGLRRDHRWAISDMLGILRSTIELI